jgi:hypothetical protein
VKVAEKVDPPRSAASNFRCPLPLQSRAGSDLEAGLVI